MIRRSLPFRTFAALLAQPEQRLARVIGAEPVVLDGRVLNRALQAMIVAGDRLGVTSTDADATVEQRRADMRRTTKLGMPTWTSVSVTERRIAGPGGELPLRVYRPLGLTGTPPAIVYLHGGGWVVGDLDTHDSCCRLLSLESRCVVIAVDYRLAPEHPFPAAVDDAVAAYRWVHTHSRDLSIDPGRVGVMGDSAGGNLAAVVAQLMRDSDVPAPVAQCLIYPATDANMCDPSHDTFAEGFFLTADSIRWYRSRYLPDPETWSSPLASPVLEADLSGLAPALVVTAGFDPLRDEGRRYADRLADAGVDTSYRCYDDMVHGFFGMGVLPGGLGRIAEICASMGELMHRP